jgi:biotin-dependent carboxylase-like uncharacterized protein
MTVLAITRAGPLTTLQDRGRPGMLPHGISASGPMDRRAYGRAGAALGRAGETAVEFTQGLAFEVDGPVDLAANGGAFRLKHNGKGQDWPAVLSLGAGDRIDIAPGPSGNYGYLRFSREIDVPPVLRSRATNVTVGLGGLEGRALRDGDRLVFGEAGQAQPKAGLATVDDGPIRIMWGLHADLFGSVQRQAFLNSTFAISAGLDRMGVRLLDPSRVFRSLPALTLVSDAIIAGDIQILGDGTPIVLMRDHQPTGGYPRIATIAAADLDRFAQLRPGSEISFTSVSLEHAR